MSGKDLSDHQILLLSKGLSFVPTARDSSHFELLKDFDKFCNRVRSLSLVHSNKPMVKKFPLKRISKHTTKRTLLSTPKLEGALEAMKIEISQIPLTDNIPTMGTKLAPAYANIFMGKLEQSIFSHAPLKPSFYRRFIDDILMLWPHSELELKNFLQNLNSFHPSIKFTSEYSPDKITFLDVNIYKGPNFHVTKTLEFETFVKPTNKQAYIHASSYHPPGVSKGVAIGEMK